MAAIWFIHVKIACVIQLFVDFLWNRNLFGCKMKSIPKSVKCLIDTHVTVKCICLNLGGYTFEISLISLVRSFSIEKSWSHNHIDILTVSTNSYNLGLFNLYLLLCHISAFPNLISLMFLACHKSLCNLHYATTSN